MATLPEIMRRDEAFLCGVELVTTRGTIAETKSVRIRDFATELVSLDGVDWVSITDNAGGNPMLSPIALGKPVLYAGKEVLIHLSCKDFNRNGLESAAWQLASEGFHNILALSGDYPVKGYRGGARSVFDIDSVGLLTMIGEMNAGLPVVSKRTNGTRRLRRTQFFAGAVASNFKLHENEVMPQYLKLEKKIESGARYIIAQVGYDAAKSSELIAYMHHRGHAGVPLIGNVFMLNPRVAGVFNEGRVPGVVVSDELRAECERQGKSPDKGRSFFLDFAAKQMAVYRGLGYRGAFLGGVHSARDVREVLNRAAVFAPDDWKEFAGQIQYSRPGEFFYFARNPDTGLAEPGCLNPDYEASLHQRPKTNNVTWGYRFSRKMHDAAFVPGTKLFNLGRKIYSRAKDAKQGPAWLRMIEHASKSVMFSCKDCGDCSLPDTAFLCPESQCAKNQRNGPCGGTRDGLCEVDDKECIWSRAYDRMKFEDRASGLLAHAPVVQNETLRGTSSWANTFLGRDHNNRDDEEPAEKPPAVRDRDTEPERKGTVHRVSPQAALEAPPAG